MKRAMSRPSKRVSRHSAVFFGCVVAVALALAGINGCLMTYDPDGVDLPYTDTTPSMLIVSPTANQMFADCTGHDFSVCLPVEIDLRNVDMVPKWGEENVAGEGHLYVTVAPTGDPGAANPITAVDQGVVERNFTIDISNLPDGSWTLRVEVRNNDRTLHVTVEPVSVDFRKSS